MITRIETWFFSQLSHRHKGAPRIIGLQPVSTTAKAKRPKWEKKARNRSAKFKGVGMVSYIICDCCCCYYFAVYGAGECSVCPGDDMAEPRIQRPKLPGHDPGRNSAECVLTLIFDPVFFIFQLEICGELHSLFAYCLLLVLVLDCSTGGGIFPMVVHRASERNLCVLHWAANAGVHLPSWANDPDQSAGAASFVSTIVKRRASTIEAEITRLKLTKQWRREMNGENNATG